MPKRSIVKASQAPAVKRHHENSDELCRYMANDLGIDTVMMSFSMGKDSLATYLQARKYFPNIVPVFYYMVPHLEFQERSLAYYEKVIGRRILRYPSPDVYSQMHDLMFQLPDRADAILENKNFVIYDYDFLFWMAKLDAGVPEDTFTILGITQNDNLTRRQTINKNGPINPKRRQFFPIYDWNIARIESEIRASGIKLPVDYKVWGRTFDCLQFKFLKPLKDNFPDDYRRILEWWPLAKVELRRYEDFLKDPQKRKSWLKDEKTKI